MRSAAQASASGSSHGKTQSLWDWAQAWLRGLWRSQGAKMFMPLMLALTIPWLLRLVFKCDAKLA